MRKLMYGTNNKISVSVKIQQPLKNNKILKHWSNKDLRETILVSHNYNMILKRGN